MFNAETFPVTLENYDFNLKKVICVDLFHFFPKIPITVSHNNV